MENDLPKSEPIRLHPQDSALEGVLGSGSITAANEYFSKEIAVDEDDIQGSLARQEEQRELRARLMQLDFEHEVIGPVDEVGGEEVVYGPDGILFLSHDDR